MIHPDGRYLLYGLLDNRESDHDLRFIGCTDDVPEAVAELGDQYPAYLGLPRATVIHWEPGMRVLSGIDAGVALFTGATGGHIQGV